MKKYFEVNIIGILPFFLLLLVAHIIVSRPLTNNSTTLKITPTHQTTMYHDFPQFVIKFQKLFIVNL